MWYVYILKSKKDGKFYIGCTDNINRRVKEHNLGQNLSTKNRRPLELIYKEIYQNQSEAFEREKVIKSYKGGNAFKKLLSL